MLSKYLYLFLSPYKSFLSVRLKKLTSVILLTVLSFPYVIGIFDEFERTRRLYDSDIESARLASQNRLKKRTLKNFDRDALSDTEEKQLGEM